jgi:biopolymer transport protein TolR
MGMSAGGKGGVKADINVTPLVDVVLVLLIIFMVVTPMLQRGKAVELPSAHKHPDGPKTQDPLIVSITNDKRMFVEKDEYPTDNALKDALTPKFQMNPAQTILLKGDKALTFGDVRKVMNDIRQAGAKGVKLGVQELKEQ